jgi:predicted Zn-dependent peptidase
MIEDITELFNKNDNLIGGSNINKFKKTKLNLFTSKNNMDTLLIPLSNSNTITVGIFIRAGSRQETDAFGIAHFLEHMTFKGTNKRTSESLMIELDSIGAHYNAMTGHEFTLYYISGDPRDIDRLIDIITDLYLNPIYPEKDIEKERNVVIEELKMSQDSNHKCLSNALYKNLFNNLSDELSSLGRPIIGYEDTIKKMNRSDIMKYRENNYKPSNCLFCISGNFHKKEVLKIVAEKFNTSLHKKKLTHNLFYDNMLNNNSVCTIKNINKNIQKYTHINKDINQTIINFVFNSFNSYNLNNNAVDLFCDTLSNGFSSRFFNLLRNKLGVSYYNNSFNRTFNDIGHLIISVGVEHKSVVNTIKELLKELKNIKENGITEQELQKAKKQNETSLLFQFKDPYEYLMYYGMNYLIKKPLYSLSDILRTIDDVKLSDLNDITKSILTKDNIIIGSIGKVSDSDIKEINKLIVDF